MIGTSTIAAAACAYAKRGWKPVPIKRGGDGKKAIGKDWQKRPFEPNQFDGNAQNVAIQLGEVSKGLTDVDLDCRDAIGMALDFLPETQAIFGRNGKPASHMLYMTDLYKTEPKAVTAYKHQDVCLLELRTGGNGRGAVSVFPPSVKRGETVMWVRDGEPAQITGADLKRRVLLLAMACVLKSAYPGEGARHEAALVLGGVLARTGFDADSIRLLMCVLAHQARDNEANDRIDAAISALDLKSDERPGFPRLAEVWGKDVADTLAKWLHAETTKSIGPGGFEDTIALEFAKLHGDDYRYVAKSSQWMHWSGTCWREESTLRAFDLARDLCRAAGRIGDAKARTVNGVATLARADRRIAATMEQWDRDQDVLCTPAGTVDLKTGEMRPAARTDYCTKQTAVAPAPPGTTCDLWLTFLDTVTNKDDELIAFLKRFAGYCLTGHVHEHVMAFLYGTGGNGKGTFIRVLDGILGNYSIISPIECFC